MEILDTVMVQGKRKRAYYKLICPTCSNEFQALKDNVDRGFTKQCASCGRSAANKKRKIPEAARNALYQDYRKGAVSRGYSFELTIEQFEALTLDNCHYCGIAPSKTIKVKSGAMYIYNGIDRVNNAIGYIESNVVSCCTDCNIAKASMTHDAYIALCKRVAEKHK